MNITILGGGNIGTLMAAECARKGHRVTVHTSRPGLWSRELWVHDLEDAPPFSARIAEVTDDLARAVRGAEVVFITLPAETFPALARDLAPEVRPGQRIGVMPGSGGAEFAFRELLQKGAWLFGVQRVHSIARLRERGRSVAMLGRKPELRLAAIPGAQAAELARMMTALFDMPCRVLSNYLSVTLTPSNPPCTPRACIRFSGTTAARTLRATCFFMRNGTTSPRRCSCVRMRNCSGCAPSSLWSWRA